MGRTLASTLSGVGNHCRILSSGGPDLSYVSEMTGFLGGEQAIGSEVRFRGTNEEAAKILQTGERVAWVPGQQHGWRRAAEGWGSWYISKVEPRGLHMTASCPPNFGDPQKRVLREARSLGGSLGTPLEGVCHPSLPRQAQE